MDTPAPRSISTIAFEIELVWDNVNFAAAPYLEAMKNLDKITDSYGYDSGESIVRYFLSNATTWRGDIARATKAELRAMLR